MEILWYSHVITERGPGFGCLHLIWARWPPYLTALSGENTSVSWRTMWVLHGGLLEHNWSSTFLNKVIIRLDSFEVLPVYQFSAPQLTSLSRFLYSFPACDTWLEGGREVCGRWGASLCHAEIQRGPRLVAHHTRNAHQHARWIRIAA